MLSDTFQKRLRTYLLPTLGVVAAAVLAVLGIVLGQPMLVLASLNVLALAVSAAVFLVPGLWQRAKLDRLLGFQQFRFTLRGGLFLLAVLAVAFASFNTGNNLLVLVLSVLLAALIASGIVATQTLRGLKVSLNLPQSFHARQRVVFFLSLQNTKRRLPSFALRVRARFREAGGEGEVVEIEERTFPYIPAGERARTRMEVRFPRRGLWEVSGFQIATSFPFGFFMRGRPIELGGQIVVYPPVFERDAGWLNHPRFAQGRRDLPRKGPGRTLYSIRRYQSGDRARFVHWKSTAKLGQLMVKDFALEEDQPVVVVFSTSLPNRAPRTLRRFEVGVAAVASVVRDLYEKGRRLHFSSQDLQISVGSCAGYERLMEFLAQVKPSPKRQLEIGPLVGPAILFAAGESARSDNALSIDYLSEDAIPALAIEEERKSA